MFRRAVSRRVLPAAGLAASILLAGCAAAPEPENSGAVRVLTPDSPSGYTGVELDRPYAKPDLPFSDTAGRPYSLAKNATKPVTLVFFGYTNCTDGVCNTVMADVATALRRVDPEVRARTEVVFVTTDPRHDTPAVIRKYLDRFDPAFVGLTAELAVMEQAARSLGIALPGNTRLPGGGYDVAHSAQLIGFAPDGLGRVVWMPDKLTVPGLRDDVRKLAGS